MVRFEQRIEALVARAVAPVVKGATKGVRAAVQPDSFEKMGEAAGKGVFGVLRGLSDTFANISARDLNALRAGGAGAGQGAAAYFGEMLHSSVGPSIAQMVKGINESGFRKQYSKLYGSIAVLPIVALGIKKGMDVGATAIKNRIMGSARRDLERGFYKIVKPKDLHPIPLEHHIGHASAKEELMNFMKRLDTPHLNAALNARDPRRRMSNVLLYGLPGTGKTDLVRILASNLDKKKKTMFVSLDVEKLVQLEDGTGARNVRKLEEMMRKSRAKRIILAVDEIDGLIARTEASANNRQATTAVLKLIDGITPIKGKEIMVVGMTNYVNKMDDALLNRFRTTIYMGAPSREEMIQMYQLYFKQKGLQLPDDLDWDKIVKESKGFTGRVIEQTTMNLQEMMLKRDMELAKALDQEIRKKGPKALDGAELSFTQADLLEAIAKTRKPKRIKGDYDLAS